MKRVLLALLMVVAVPVASAAPAPKTTTPAAVPAKAGSKAKKIRTVEGITEYRLDNGLQVLLFPDQTQSTVTVNITYLVGSRFEGYGETGMAHLLEHMMFKGSPRHRNVLKIVGERGGQLNGTTWLDRTNYFETLPASQENLDWTLDLESDRMRNASISPDDLKTEFSVVRNEFEMGENNPQSILDERIVSTAFLWHNYGKSTIGSRADIERVPTTALHAFYDKYYQPDNAVLVVSGKFDDAAALASIEKFFGSIAKPSRQLQPPYTVEPQQDGERNVTLRRNGDVNVIGLAYHTVAGTADDFPAVEAAVDVLTREPAGRLYKKLVETKLAASVSGYDMSTHDPYLAQFSAQVRDAKNVDKVQQIMTSEIEGLAAGKIEDKEVERWRTATLKELELAMADSQQIAVELSEYAALGDWRTIFAYRERVKKVTTADVVRVAKTFFKQSNRTTGRFIPTKDIDRAPLVETPDVAAFVKGIEGGQSQEQGEVFVATLDNIEARTKRTELKGGIKAAFLPKKTRGGKVALTLQLHWGDEKSLQNKATAADLLCPMLARGTAKKSYQDLQDAEDQLKAHISCSSNADGVTMRIETLRDKLPGAIDLAAEMLKEPSFPAKELEIVKQEQLAALEERKQDPMSSAFTTLQQLTSKWPKSDPRYPQSVDEQIAALKKVSLGEIKAYYKDFAGAGHGELAVVGDHDPAAITTQIEKQFATWQTKKPYKRLEDKAFGVAGQEKSIDIKDKEMTTLAIAEDVQMKDTDADYAAWLMLAQVLGGDGGSRAWMRIREKEGLSYGVATWATADSFDPVGSFGGYAIVAPQNLAKAKSALIEEITKMVTGTVTADELKRAKDNWIKDQDTSLSNDDYVVQMLARQTYRSRTSAFTKELRAKIQAVTADDIARVGKKYLDPKRLTVVDAGDVAKQKAK
ncbi:MAG TPA: pitrilysin family protein [Kofleriaceae bacterium]|nr:pitrilysin family protein [Kofleriaceae bacterium]